MLHEIEKSIMDKPLYKAAYVGADCDKKAGLEQSV
jgi:hypothetical protein